MGFITDLLKDIPVSAVLREKLQDLEKKYEELEVENTQLKDENQKLEDENQKLNTQIKKLTSSGELCEIEVNILKLLSSHGPELTAEMIASILGLNHTKTEYYLEKMNRQYVFSHDYYTERQSEYFLSQEGREYLVKHDLVE